MSFGFGIGDIALVIRYSDRVISALREDGSKAEYQDAIGWCQGLQSVLGEIEEFQRNEAAEEFTDSLGVECVVTKASIMRYRGELAKYDKSMGKESSKGAHHGSLRKVQWALREAKSLNDFRSSLQMQLEAISLRMQKRILSHADQIPVLGMQTEGLQLSIQRTNDSLSNMHQALSFGLVNMDDQLRAIQTRMNGTFLLDRVSDLADMVLRLALTRSDPAALPVSRVFTLPDSTGPGEWEASLTGASHDREELQGTTSRPQPDNPSEKLERLNAVLRLLGIREISEAEASELTKQDGGAEAFQSALRVVNRGNPMRSNEGATQSAFPGNPNKAGFKNNPPPDQDVPGPTSSSSNVPEPIDSPPEMEGQESSETRETAGEMPQPAGSRAKIPRPRSEHRGGFQYSTSTDFDFLNIASDTLRSASAVMQISSLFASLFRDIRRKGNYILNLTWQMNEFSRLLKSVGQTISSSPAEEVRKLAEEVLTEANAVVLRLANTLTKWLKLHEKHQLIRIILPSKLPEDEIDEAVSKMKSLKMSISMIMQLHSHSMQEMLAQRMSMMEYTVVRLAEIQGL